MSNPADQNGSPPGPKNIVYIMFDDADYLDVGYNSGLVPSADALTPNIGGLREGGMAFTQFYSGAPVCTPDRASMLTGDVPVE